MDGSSPEVRTGAGAVRGAAEGTLAVFRGIPYARPPVGELRFAAPAPPVPWDGVREATAFGSPPPQSALLPTLAPPAPPGADPDDWLTVNVWTPSLGAEAGLPVMVWIYGGAYRLGTSSQPSYDGTRLAELGVVVVTFNHRLGVEGFAELAGKPANRSLLDDVAALRWVHENIAAFGGDPGQVTVFGESAGAGAVASLLVMPSAAGLFGRAIAQSMPGVFLTPELAGDVTKAVAAQEGIPATTEAFAAADPAVLAAASDRVWAREHPAWGQLTFVDTPFAPVVDGEVLPCAPWRALATGTGRNIDLIVGHNRDEYRLFLEFAGLRGTITEEMAVRALRGLVPPIPGADGEKAYRAAYPDAGPEELYELVLSDWVFRMPSLHLAQSHAVGGGRTFLYELTYESRLLGACHALDIPLVFGTNAELGEFLLGDRPAPQALALGDLMRAEWVAFARTGDPGWPAYSVGRRLTRVYSADSDVRPYPENASMHVWDQRRFDVLDLAHH